jgi:hypothetical protein
VIMIFITARRLRYSARRSRPSPEQIVMPVKVASSFSRVLDNISVVWTSEQFPSKLPQAVLRDFRLRIVLCATPQNPL